jgi:uncharacterized protein (TIGR03435 family)
MKKIVVASIVIGSVSAAVAQQVFDVALFRSNRSGAEASSVGQRPGGQYVMTNGPIYLLLMNAFRPQNNEIIGAPSWVSSERYDLQAKANATTSSDDLRSMLRALLEDRLKLKAHLEPRDRPAFFLVAARADRRLGPDIERTSRDCAAVVAADRAGTLRPVLAPPSNGAPPCGMQASDGEIRAGGLTMDILARNLGMRVGRPVFDRTGIEGYFDLTLKYAPQNAASTEMPSLFSALQEQLGLKLESGVAPLQTLVIEHIERPATE